MGTSDEDLDRNPLHAETVECPSNVQNGRLQIESYARSGGEAQTFVLRQIHKAWWPPSAAQGEGALGRRCGCANGVVALAQRIQLPALLQQRRVICRTECRCQQLWLHGGVRTI